MPALFTSTSMRGERLDPGLDLASVGHVADQRGRLAALVHDGGAGRIQRRLRAPDQDDGSAGLGERQRRTLAEPAAGAGHHRLHAVETKRVHLRWPCKNLPLAIRTCLTFMVGNTQVSARGQGMAVYLKRGQEPEAIRAAGEQVSETVRGILADLEARGDAAVRDYSEKFDRWSPPSFRLSQAEIDALVASVPQRTIDDITFAQAQIRHFAKAQKDALKDIEVDDAAGRDARPQEHPRARASAATCRAAAIRWWRRPT